VGGVGVWGEGWFLGCGACVKRRMLGGGVAPALMRASLLEAGHVCLEGHLGGL
jgi:hypothetical protein